MRPVPPDVLRATPLIALLLAAACTRDLGLREATFACSASLPCAEGYLCDPVTALCRREADAPPDAGARDAAHEPRCGDGLREGGEACDDGNDEPLDGCDRCALRPMMYTLLPRFLRMTAAVTATTGVIVAAGQRPVRATSAWAWIAPDGTPIAEAPVTCEGRPNAVVFSMARLPDGHLLGVGMTWTDAEVASRPDDRTTRTLWRLDAAGNVERCATRPSEYAEAVGRSVLALMDGTAIVAGNVGVWGHFAESELGWLERVDGQTLDTLSSFTATVTVRWTAMSQKPDGDVLVVGRRAGWWAPEGVLLHADPTLSRARLELLPPLGMPTAVAHRGADAWVFGQNGEGSPQALALRDGEARTVRPLPLPALQGHDWFDVHSVIAWADGSGVIAGSATIKDQWRDAVGYLAYLDAQGAVQRIITFEQPFTDERTVVLREGEASFVALGSDGERGMVERWPRRAP